MATAVLTIVVRMPAVSPPFSDLANRKFFLAVANDLAVCSTSLFVESRNGFSRNLKKLALRF